MNAKPRSLPVFVILGLLLGAPAAFAQPDLEVCVMPALPLSSTLPPAVSVIGVAVNQPIADIQIGLEITHTWIGDLTITIESPTAASIFLVDPAASSSVDNISVNFNDQGIPFDITLLPNGEDMQPQTGTFADIVAVTASTLGDWTLTVADTVGGDSGTLDEWCLKTFQSIPPPPPIPVENLSCASTGGSGIANLTWTNPIAYTSIEVSVNGILEATLAGSATSYDTNPQPVGTTLDVCVVGVLGSSAAPVCCLVELLPTGAIQECSAPGAPISNTLPPVVDAISVASAVTIGDAWVRVDITHTWIGDLSLNLESPSTTVVTLKATGGGNIDDIHVTFDDAGVPYDVAQLPSGLHMQVQGPGTLADYDNQNTLGDWTLTVADTVGGDQGTLDSWCMVFFEACSFPAPSNLTCAESGGNVDLAWTNTGAAASIEVYDGQVLIATLPGSATTHTDAGAAPGAHSYRVAAIDGCASFSPACNILFGITDVIYAGEAPSDIDSVAALEAALQSLGNGVLVVTDLTHAAINVPERLWVMLGTFPDYHTVTAAEGIVLAELNTGDLGLDGSQDQAPVPIYVEGGDHWGFNAATTFRDYDGVLGLAADGNVIADGDDNLLFLNGLDSALGLDLTGLDATYNQDQTGSDWTDELLPTDSSNPDLGGDQAAPIWNFDDAGTLQNTGIFYASTFATVIACSHEFGGYAGDQNTLAGLYAAALVGGVGPTDRFIRGDINQDGTLDISDAIFVLAILFSGVPITDCRDAEDVNNDNAVDVSDPIYALATLFSAGPTPPAPFPNCGSDPNPIGACDHNACP